MNPEPPPHYNRGAVTIPGRRGEPFRLMLQFSVRPHRAAAALGPICLALCLVTFVTEAAAAQTVTATTGAVNGVVTDSTKAVIPG